VNVAGDYATATLPRLVQETLRAWRQAKIKLTAGLFAASIVLIVVVGDLAGIFTRHGATAIRTTHNALADNAAGSSTPIGAPAIASAAKTASPPRKTGAITGIVLDEEGNPIWGASVWGGNWEPPFARDVTDQAGRFALDKTNTPNVVTVN